jgi:RNA-directed DNA polymerase
MTVCLATPSRRAACSSPTHPSGASEAIWARSSARWPSRKATQHARDRIGELTQQQRLWLPDEWVAQELNQFLRGWGGYFRYGNSAWVFDVILQYALERFPAFVGKRHQRSSRWGMRKVTCGSPDNLGLITLCGTVVVPRPFRPWKATAERRR